MMRSLTCRHVMKRHVWTWIWGINLILVHFKNICGGFSIGRRIVQPNLFLGPGYGYGSILVLHNRNHPRSRSERTSLESGDCGAGGTNEFHEFENGRDLNSLREKATNLALIEKLLCEQTSDIKEEPSLVQMEFIGRGTIGNNETQESSKCLFLAPMGSASASGVNTYEGGGKSKSSSSILTYQLSLPIPLPDSSSNGVIKLLSFAYKGQPISKSLCLTLNPLLINRDGALYDNLPWESWTVDPLLKNRDAANNHIDKKYHLGKRDAYNRFMGKDWYGRSLSIGNMAARAKYLLENEIEDNNPNENNVKNGDRGRGDSDDEAPDTDTVVVFDESATLSLAQRVLELEVKEARMAVAEIDEQSAILKAELGFYDIDSLSDEALIENFDALQSSTKAVQDAKDSLSEREEALESLLSRRKQKQGVNDIITSASSEEEETSFLGGLLSAIMDIQKSDAPYRGAIGYKPTIDTKEEMLQKSILPYCSPFEIMNEIIQEQLNAEVIGVIIEDTSLFSGSTIFGGGIVIKRKGRKKKVSIDGETIEFEDDDDDFGNTGIKKGEVMIVECDGDEAIGMALTCELSITITEAEWEKSKIGVSTTFSKTSLGEESNTNSMDVLPNLEIVIDTIEIANQGDGTPSQNTKIQKPRGDAEISFFGSPNDDKPVFNTDIPVKSLGEFDKMTDEDKAQLLLTLESFKGKLPRPRILRSTKNKGSESGDESRTNLNALDELLLPLIDESVRRQVLMRSAEEKGDMEMLNDLERAKSRRQMAKEKYTEAKNEGRDDLAAMWGKEVDFYGSLRADVTQDEGSYSSFLDRDEWYERTRQKLAEKNKKRFGSLLDGLE